MVISKEIKGPKFLGQILTTNLNEKAAVEENTIKHSLQAVSEDLQIDIKGSHQVNSDTYSTLVKSRCVVATHTAASKKLHVFCKKTLKRKKIILEEIL